MDRTLLYNETMSGIHDIRIGSTRESHDIRIYTLNDNINIMVSVGAPHPQVIFGSPH
jgi:hypothetical protein